jgi:hypothetical protein
LIVEEQRAWGVADLQRLAAAVDLADADVRLGLRWEWLLRPQFAE